MTDNKSKFSLLNVQYNRKIQQTLLSQIEKDKHYIEELERLLNEHQIDIPNEIIEDFKNKNIPSNKIASNDKFIILKADYGIDGSLDSLQKHLKLVQTYIRRFPLYVQFKDLSYWNLIPDKRIVTVGTAVHDILFGSGKKHRFDILHELTGRIAPSKITLLMGPPSSGKTSLLKALSGQLVVGSSHLDGEITYNQDGLNSKKFLCGKLASYVDEKDEHIPTLTVKETSEFAFNISTGGHHSYQVSQLNTAGTISADSPNQFFDEADRISLKMNNILRILGIYECSNTVVGDGMLRGVSGGQKRRVTIAEMMMLPRYVSFMDSISNGLDSQTTFEIIRSVRTFTRALGFTSVISLLQPSPEVFYTFDELILLGSGQIIYHGPINEVQVYFENLGYVIPSNMDIADFLQELPTVSGKRFLKPNSSFKGSIDELVKAWKGSRLFTKMVEEMDLYNKEGTYNSHETNVDNDLESNHLSLVRNVAFTRVDWWKEHNEKYPSTLSYQLKLCLDRQKKLVYRDLTFLKGTAIRVILISVISGTLFSNLATGDFYGVSGILFFSSMTNAVNGFSSLPKIYEQRAVFYKHSRAYFYPTSAFVLSQTLVMYPVQLFESITFSVIVYWSVGLSSDNGGGRFFTFIVLTYLYSLSMGQFFRALGAIASSAQTATPIGGVALILMVLFSGYILPKNQIPDGWIWFYWVNPIAYIFKAYLVNEFTASDYDYLQCLNADCSKTERFGDWVLSNDGIPTDYAWVWYSAIILFALYVFYMVASVFLYENIRHVNISLPNEEKDEEKLDLLLENDKPIELPDVSIKEENDVTIADNDKNQENVDTNSFKDNGIDFEPISFVFRNIWYKVVLKNGEEIDLLKGVSGYFEPGHMTALMGSSGAGKTTLLDVLSGRKTTGVITGDIVLNGKPKNDRIFRKLIGYVEQFDTLSPQDTAREAIAFSAAMRLPRGTVFDSWVTSVLSMLELIPIQDTMIGTMESGGMSFEQRKRVSMGVELAANPAILFLDEPTTGLDSRAAQVVIRCIKRLLAGGRSVVCTIHQPSTYIFESFDKLLLLKRGGQTVFFGDLGVNSSSLVSYFEEIPGVKPKEQHQNPATYMLQVIGAGTDSKASLSSTDFHVYYKSSVLCTFNTNKVDILCNITSAEEDSNSKKEEVDNDDDAEVYNATYTIQFRYLMHRALLTYWRSPSYNFARIAVCVIIAFIFASAYSNQTYSTSAECISRVALIYITTTFLGIVGLQIVQPVIFSQRPSFYREKYINIYDVKLYTIAHTLVELPYLLVSSVLFLLPYFFIIGFNDGDVTVKFFYYWLYQALFMAATVFIGIMLASSLPDPGVAAIASGLLGTCMSLFCGFTILYQDFPSFWQFMYWLDPLHYTIEGIVVTQFHGDNTKVTLSTGGNSTTAELFITDYYSAWEYSSRIYDFIALIIFIIVARTVTYFSLEYVNHAKR